ncbi:16S rRNA (cytosine(1402)-N(4))-methyltransferase RsmH [Actinotalea fermentans]|uniref:Ribosomal RNA small subunit methyltransferase H n=1 Tax=Actinotalea fermentans TaxID=43671 RepID=A0A511YVM6_9CELL|nr:16S rRNA (cytosine(1402)-N(4))-methyltransferase RsmH [Actinotalea fermentans]KGM17371.1 16S rRNA methyltransferase [Actinotalea fermentans ATCC 43279 = JCM 9966 = DSM 3133]GEN79243.1 ribosomal RNA small subunit methyltransferase H [Actinotalea fermentans]
MAETPAAQPARHVPVLLERCVELLAPAVATPDAVLVDMTLGLGGHAEAFLQRFPGLRVVGLDRDAQALALAGARLAPFGDRFTAVQAVYDDVLAVVERVVGRPVQGVLADLGVSSMQLDEADRGFSYAQDAPLDMRMDAGSPLTAAEVLNTYPERELVRILRTYGEERFAPRIARAVVAARASAPLARTGELVSIVRSAIPAAARTSGGNPAKRTFQAVRIEVNDELGVLERALPAALESVDVAGRVVVLAYHSLEDRLVKQAFARGATSSAPRGLPVEPETHRAYLRLLTRGAELAGDDERATNPRSSSVRLRAVERLRPTPDHLRTVTAGWAA